MRYINNYFNKISKDNNVSSSFVDNTLISNKEKRLNSYINNVIVNYAKNKLTENDFLKVMVHQQDIKGKLYDRKKILKSYLSKKTPIFNNKSIGNFMAVFSKVLIIRYSLYLQAFQHLS